MAKLKEYVDWDKKRIKSAENIKNNKPSQNIIRMWIEEDVEKYLKLKGEQK